MISQLVYRIYKCGITKIPERGVKHIQLFCDDRIIYVGSLKKVGNSNNIEEKISNTGSFRMSANIGGSKFQSNSTIILFTCDSQITQKIDENALSNGNLKHKYISGETCAEGSGNCVKILFIFLDDTLHYS